MSGDAFTDGSGVGWTDSDTGIRRRILSDRPEMMMVEVAFEAGAIGAPHQHPHVQATRILSGIFDFTIDGETKRLRPGDACIIAPNLVHGCVAVEAGLLLDVFTPRRDDFLTSER